MTRPFIHPRVIANQQGITPLHQLGQNFLSDSNLVDAIIRDANLRPDEPVLEVGPGTGSLSRALVNGRRPYLAVELDRGLAEYLHDEFQGEGEILQGDILNGKQDFHPEAVRWACNRAESGEKVVVMSNLPYAISTPFLTLLAEQRMPWKKAVLMVQKEFSDRALAPPGRNNSPLAVLRRLFLNYEVLREVPRTVFWPRPGVASVMISISPNDAAVPPEFPDFLRLAFSSRRKQLSRIIRQAYSPKLCRDAFCQTGVDDKIRAEQCTAEQFFNLFTFLQDNQAE